MWRYPLFVLFLFQVSRYLCIMYYASPERFGAQHAEKMSRTSLLLRPSSHCACGWGRVSGTYSYVGGHLCVQVCLYARHVVSVWPQKERKLSSMACECKGARRRMGSFCRTDPPSSAATMQRGGLLFSGAAGELGTRSGSVCRQNGRRVC